MKTTRSTRLAAAALALAALAACSKDSKPKGTPPGPAGIYLTLGPTATAGGVESVIVGVASTAGGLLAGYTGTVTLTSTDAAAVLPAPLVFTAADAGTKTVQVSFRTAGGQLLTAADTAGLRGNAGTTVAPGAAASIVLAGVPAVAAAGAPIAATLTAKDAFGNVATGFAGTATITSDDPAAVLPAPVTFATADAGRKAVGLGLRTAGARAVTVGVTGLPSATANVEVAPAPAASIALALEGSYVVDDAHVLTATVRDAYGNVATGFGGTVSFANTDLAAPSIADVAFAPADHGVKAVSGVRFYTAGDQAILASSAALSGRVEHVIAPAPAVALALVGAPGAVDAGEAFAVTAEARDLHDNLATGFSGAVAFSSDDAAARLPAAGLAGAGVRLATVTFETAPTAALTASAAGLADGIALVTVRPGAALLALTLPADANAGEEVLATLTVKDAYGNAVPTFTGTVTFATSDPGAAAPPSLLLDGTQPASVPVPMTFATLGVQSLTATALARSATTSATVHGLVYADPAPGGRVRLVRNVASTASVVQLDLVAGNGLVASYGAGLALPLTPGKVVADATLLVEPATAAFALGTAPKAVAAALPTTGPAANVLLAGVSQKAAGAGAKTTDTTLALGATVFSVRLRLAAGATPGTVLDGAALAAGARAAVRDRLGKDTAELADFAIGQLVVR
ncbi:MAG: hypothetical protein U0229_18200 [Anaeromyxobacter sp.]